MGKKLGETIPATKAGKEIKKVFVFTKNSLDKLPTPFSGKRYYVHDKHLPKLRCLVTDTGSKSLCAVLTVDGKTTHFPVNPDGYSTVDAVSLDDARAYVASLLGMSQAQLKELRASKETRGQRKSIAARAANYEHLNDSVLYKLSDAEKRKLTTEEVLLLYLAVRKDKISKWTDRAYSRSIPRHFPDEYQLPFSEILDRNLMLKAIANNRGAMASVRHINALYNWAKNNILDENYAPIFDQINPAEQLMKTKLKEMAYQPRDNALKPKEMTKWFNVIEQLDDPRDAEYLAFILLTGMRSGDTANNLRWENLDFDRNEFSLLTKGKSQEMAFPLPKYIADKLKKRKNHAAPGDLVFPNATANQRSKLIKIIGKQMKRNISLHDLRRTYSQVAMANGISNETIKQLINHNNGSDVTSKHYVNNVANISAWRSDTVINPMQIASDIIVDVILTNASRNNAKAKVVSLRRK